MGVARQLYELHNEAGMKAEAAQWAKACLESMQLVMETKVCFATWLCI